ncbi:hypothetical protein CLTEP_25590 [Clostridium tepidiprofundi DSM 19306]|uniref:Uncharacterized protein n=1 Tax=Clostridium tepidiprofundi DSM 19306 TaxID=1121338 RepID=A0A151ASG6_9CLOT|nr:hypothetical protein CLTEP_25590 [Clostridium tepidiprofundi DSM 19306]
MLAISEFNIYVTKVDIEEDLKTKIIATQKKQYR